MCVGGVSRCMVGVFWSVLMNCFITGTKTMLGLIVFAGQTANIIIYTDIECVCVCVV